MIKNTALVAIICGIALSTLSQSACCSLSELDRSASIRAVGIAARAVSTQPAWLPLRVGDTASFVAEARESYLGDLSCQSAGQLSPPSDVQPERYAWSSAEPELLSVSATGQATGVRPGPVDLLVEHLDPSAKGSRTLLVVPWFDSIHITPARDSIHMGDTMSVFLTAYAGDTPMPEIDHDGSLLTLRATAGAPGTQPTVTGPFGSENRWVIEPGDAGTLSLWSGTGVLSARAVVTSMDLTVHP